MSAFFGGGGGKKESPQPVEQPRPQLEKPKPNVEALAAEKTRSRYAGAKRKELEELANVARKKLLGE